MQLVQFCFNFTVDATKTAHYLWGARLLALRPGIRFRIDLIQLNQPFLIKNSSKHFYSITLPTSV